MTSLSPAFAGPGRGLRWAVRGLLATAGALLALLVAAPAASAAPSTWTEVADQMAVVLGQADTAYRAGDPDAAKAAVNEAYYGSYEKLGFEATVMGHISGERAAAVEYQFANLLKDINAGLPADQLGADIDVLVGMLREDAATLDGKEDANPYAVLVQALLIMLREGVEAILVLGAIIAYLVKTGNADKTRIVYLGAGAALLASVLLAWLLNTLTGLAGANQEVIEGATILLAVAMLVYVSNWILSRSGEDAFERYLERKSEESLARGSVLTLAFVAFLAVFREGAEVILFYQALLARSPEGAGQLWLGMGIGIVALVGVYLAIRLLAIRIPLRPFFLTTSALLAVMAFSFAGSGIKELQEAGVVGVTSLPQVPTIDWLGVYPTAETLAAQAVVGLVLVVLWTIGLRRSRPPRPAATTETGEPPVPAQTTGGSLPP
ncbi:MAG: FTR1 family protein, partial [Propionicimonas sp.]